MEPAPGIEAEYMEDDPVVFLKRIQEQCPIVLSLLDSKQVKLISRSPTEAYDPNNVNDEYLTDMRCSVGIQQRIEDAEQNLRSALLIPRKVDKDVDVENFKKQTEVLKMVSLGIISMIGQHTMSFYITHLLFVLNTENKASL